MESIVLLFRADDCALLPETLDRLRNAGYTPSSCRELLCADRKPRALLLLADCPDALLNQLLPCLREQETVHILLQTLPDRPHWNALRGNTHISFLTAADAPCPTAVAYAERQPQDPDALYASGVRVLLADFLPERPIEKLLLLPIRRVTRESPFAMPCPTAVKTEPTVLPLCPEPVFSNPMLALSASVRLASPYGGKSVLETIDLRPQFVRESGEYSLHPLWNGLHFAPLRDRTEIPRLLAGGVYVCARTHAATVLLYGCDPIRKTLSAVLFAPCGGMCEATLPFSAADGWNDLQTVSVSPEECSSDGLYARITREDPACSDACCGRQAAVLFSNLAFRKTPCTPASLRAFLEERLVTAYLLCLHRERERLLIEPLDGYLSLLQAEGEPLLKQLLGRDTLPGSVASCATNELLRRLVNAEELCLGAFCTEWERLTALRSFQFRNERRDIP